MKDATERNVFLYFAFLLLSTCNVIDQLTMRQTDLKIRLIVALFSWALIFPALALGDCSDRQKLELFEDKHWNADQVRQFCGAGDSSSPPDEKASAAPYVPPLDHTTHFCVTPFATCAMVVPSAPGGPCTCYMPTGTFFGVVI